jgi:amidase
MTDLHNHVVMTFRAYVEGRLHWQTPYKGNSMAIERPTIEQLQALASRLNIRLTPAQAEEYLALMQANFDAYDLIDALPDEIPAVHYPRAAGYRPEGDENPLNAWYYKTEVTGAATGKLAGRTVVLKDNIALAGVPMMNGASTLEGFVPSTTPPLPPDCWMPARLFSAKPPASTSACREAAIPPIRRPCITRCATATRPVAHLLAAPLWSLPGKSIWPWVAIKGALRVFPPHGVASMA